MPGNTGDAVVRLIRPRDLIELHAEHLREHPEVFYHGCVSDDAAET